MITIYLGKFGYSSEQCEDKHDKCATWARQGGCSLTYHTYMVVKCRKSCGYCACGTDSKCGIKGGICIPASEECNGITIQEEGYCNSNYKGLWYLGCKCCFTPTVYMRDIENTIGYAFRNRAPYNSAGSPPAIGSKYRNLTIPQQQALSNFAQVLVRHLPLRSSVLDCLNCLKNALPFGSTIGGERLEGLYKDCEKDNGCELPYVSEWIDCRNTDNIRIQRFRSYPCGVWNTFHAMTVDLIQGEQEEEPRILPTLHGMVDYFPWCPDCRGHFIEMYEEYDAVSMDTAYNVTMWLWRAHNLVSVRVKDGFDGQNLKKTWNREEYCKYSTIKSSELQPLLIACKFKCKMIEDDCKYIEVPLNEDDSSCYICRKPTGPATVDIAPGFERYSLNTAPENPGQRKALFPEFKICPKCWNLVDPNDKFSFTTTSKSTKVLLYLRALYKREAIVPV